MDNLTLAVRGKDHCDFKEKVMAISDNLIIVSPLGKILKIDDFGLLNEYSDHPNKFESIMNYQSLLIKLLLPIF